MEHKECKTCGESKPWSDYYLFKGKPHGAKCKACVRKEKAAWRASPEGKAKKASEDRKHYEKNKEKIKDQRRKRYENNKDQELTYNRAYQEANKERLASQLSERIKNDPALHLRRIVSSAVWRALKKQGKVKGGRTFTALPYSSQDLVEHLEKQFDEKMNWDNYGSYWDLDHIYPQSLLPYDSLDHPNFKKCWALDNLQPLEPIANIRKSNRVTPESRRGR